MMEDEIVREVRVAREAFAASHGFNIRDMVAALHELGVASRRELVQLKPRPTSIGSTASESGSVVSPPTASTAPTTSG